MKFVFFMISILVFTCVASAQRSPEVKTKALLNYWQTNPISIDKKAEPRELPAELADVFDYKALTASAIQPHRGRFSAKQLSRYSTVFGDILRRTVHTRAGAAIGKADYKIAKSETKAKTTEVEVSAYLPEEDITTDVIFVWQQHRSWQVVDVRIDGASLVADYRNQFGRMITKNGVDGFISTLQRRLATIQES